MKFGKRECDLIPIICIPNEVRSKMVSVLVLLIEGVYVHTETNRKKRNSDRQGESGGSNNSRKKSGSPYRLYASRETFVFHVL